MGFIASEQVTPLNYDFTTLNPLPAGLERCKGTTPEPSAELLDDFAERSQSLLDLFSQIEYEEPKKSGAKKPAPPRSVDEALERWAEVDPGKAESRARANEAMIDLLSHVTQGSPSKEEIRAMPSRIRSTYLRWLTTELLVPKDLLIATSTSVEDQTTESSTTLSAAT